MDNPLFLGLDFGTSGARAIAIDEAGRVQTTIAIPFEPPVNPRDWFGIWETALEELLTPIEPDIRRRLRAIAIDGTSSTVFICDRDGRPVSEPLLYNDDRARVVLNQVVEFAPENHPVCSPTSSLAKLVWLHRFDECFQLHRLQIFCHQADWLASLLNGGLGISDYNNSLKFGYDPATDTYPDWLIAGLDTVGITNRLILPRVVSPGHPISPVMRHIADRFGLDPNCTVVAGTTDSIAAFLAGGASQPGEAVTSLGSTLAVKLLSRSRVDDARYGIYSHRLGNLWLAGGASNTGGAVLREFFSDRELAELSPTLPDAPSPLDYYPLPKSGERFPTNDPELRPRLEPRPDDRVEFLHGLLDGMARIEAQGYGLLQELGADPLVSVTTAGGGANNATWCKLRSRRLGVPVTVAAQSEAAYGAALLAKQGVTPSPGTEA